jgi:hypothetical protein
MKFDGAPSMTWDSMTLPPQSRTAIATICLFCSAHLIHASAMARAPALEIVLMSLIGGACIAGASAARTIMINRVSESTQGRMRI